ncbi:EpsG family protein [Raoultella planticola]|uniref:EpsG family protein n=1 Tax=Raoultella planticola TaxID=575 RepID=UPI001C9DE50B|nr:EpsG family protein [Raoultella planticola]MDM9677905.1 EpsG family protein [Raoultella planticola]QZS65866.1 EpsG family protein [Raoultella planticola]HDG9809110.1 EpsG family protein [Raoultella planticola]
MLEDKHDYRIALQSKLYYSYNLTFLFLVFFGVMFSPQISFWSCVFLLTGVFSRVGVLRNIIFLIAVFAILYTAVSREIGVSRFDDLIGTYMPILNSQKKYGTFEASGLGIEVGLVVYLNTVMTFFSINDTRTLLFFCVSFTLFFYTLWIFLFYSKEFSGKEKGIALAVSLAFIQIGLLAQTLRQEMATPFLLMAIFSWDRRRIFSLLLLSIAVFIHSSSLVLFLFYILFPSLRMWGKISIFIGMFLFSFCISVFPNLVINFLNAAYLPFFAKKVQYYLNTNNSTIIDALSAGKFYLIIIVIMIANNFFLKKEIVKLDIFSKKIYEFCLWGSICNLTFVTLPNASRFFLVIPGFLIYYVFLPISKRYPLHFKFFILLFALISLFVPQRLFGGGTEGFQLWDAYDWIELNPFYYILDTLN